MVIIMRTYPMIIIIVMTGIVVTIVPHLLVAMILHMIAPILDVHTTPDPHLQ